VLEGTGDEDDDVIHGHVERVKSTIARLLSEGQAARALVGGGERAP
jgi:hypothetical protein